jgi:hypothetical protein
MSDGKVGILPLDFHFSSRESPGLWECGNRAFGDFQGLWETTENLFLVFLVFHGPSFPQPCSPLFFIPPACARR